ncbi:hypothetical protein RJ640_002323 [Escallonia rubra]|uniref:3-hydroxyisobutyrate dehydrogenase-like NAD-binding domain-containing protein n=1 Tax=Escallonia rubra TaxID=112253 RepID=A0AA88R2X3_9ASTE|nr:hypothetical protein RJ640_002323 [Escallonia rubra]
MVALVLWPWCSSNWMATTVVPQMGNYSGGSSDWWRCCIGAVKTNMSKIVKLSLIWDSQRGNVSSYFGMEGLSKDVVIILRSNLPFVNIQELERSLTERSEKAFVVDMHVARGKSEALNGKLMMISSGKANSIAMARPFLNAMCSKLYVFEGELGAGSRTKMVIELLEGVHFVASLEAISLGAQAGIHPWILYDIISNAAGSSW